MNGQRLTEQLQLVFTAAEEETPSSVVGGDVEPVVAKCEPERPAVPNSLMEAVCERENLKKALRRVKVNKGSPGVDGMTVEQLPDYLRAHWPQHRDELLQRTYTPSPVRRVEIPKPDGGVRKLGVPCALDRFVQQAVLQVLQPIFDPTFSDHSYGFRPGRSAHEAVAAAQKHLASGYRYVVDLDLEKFFDRVNHDLLMGRPGPARHGCTRAEAHSRVVERRCLGERVGQCHGGRHAARRAAITIALEHRAPRV